MLAVTSYNPGTATSTTTTSTTFADVDSTNLTITFTVPASGNVLVCLEAVAVVDNGAANYWWNLRTTGGSDVSGTTRTVSATPSMTRPTATILITGLTPSASQTYRWGHAVSSNSGIIRYGDSGSSHYGAAVMEVIAAP